MKRLVLACIAIVFMLTSCDEVIFPEPQPRKVKPLMEIPETLQGTFVDDDDDTLFVRKDHFTYYSPLTDMQDYFLSDSAVLKFYKDNYYYSTAIDMEGERYWLSYLLIPGENGFEIYAMDPDDIVKLAKLQEITSKVDDVKKGDTEYHLFNPKRKHYKKIISDSVFTKMISFRKITN